MYISLLTQLKNAQAMRKEKIKMPYSEMDAIVAELLAKHHFVESVAKKGRMPKRVLEVRIAYNDRNEGKITDFRSLSKPSRRLYAGYEQLRPVRQGFGMGVISTPKGIMTNEEARKAKVGGQLLFEIW